MWDVEGLEAVAQSKGNDGAAAVAKIASFILQRFSQGTQIKLDALWQELQDARQSLADGELELQDAWQQIQDAVSSVVDHITLADLVRRYYEKCPQGE